MLNLSQRHHWVAAILFTAALTGASACAETPIFKNPGITYPSETRGLNFNVPGVVSKVLVKEGDIVKAGQVIAQEDDSVDLAELKVKEADAASSALQIDAANTDLAQKKVEFDRDSEMFKKKVLGQSDLDKAKLDVDIGIIRVALAKQETEQKKDDADAENAKIAQKKLIATINGIVKKINVHEGELATNDPKTPCIEVVLNEPLWIEVDIPIRDAAALQLGQAMDVRYRDVANSKWQSAKIIYFNPVATAGAGMQRVRLELPNPSHLRSGMQMDVALEDPSHEKDVAIASPGR